MNILIFQDILLKCKTENKKLKAMYLSLKNYNEFVLSLSDYWTGLEGYPKEFYISDILITHHRFCEISNEDYILVYA